MENLKLPAYPRLTWEEVAVNRGDNQIAYSTSENFSGFTKHEKAALMIAAGLVSKYSMTSPSDQETIAKLSLELAEEILNRAEKWTK